MPNYLKMPKKAQVLALLELGWSCAASKPRPVCGARRSVVTTSSAGQMRPKRSPALARHRRRNLPIVNLIALKILARVDVNRPQDVGDLRALLRVALAVDPYPSTSRTYVDRGARISARMRSLDPLQVIDFVRSYISERRLKNDPLRPALRASAIRDRQPREVALWQ